VSEERRRALSLAFMQGHPEQAARVLEALPPDEAARLFGHVPARLGAKVLAMMLPKRAARCLGALDDARALELLAPMGAQPSIAVLRNLPAPRRNALLAGLPTATALASTLLIGYAEDALGAWADPDVLVLPPQTRAEDALHRLRQATLSHPTIFVADAQRRLLGIVDLTAVMLAPEGSTLARLMQPAPAALAAHASLSVVAAHPGWLVSSLLPVLEPGDRLIGVLSHDAALRALRRLAPPAPAGASGLASLLAAGYWQALSGLLASAVAMLPAAAPTQGQDR
jgi:magnesium transporter